jgi:hypothetical protein
MKELIKEDLVLINGGNEASYQSGEELGYAIGRIFRAIGEIIDSLSPNA